MHKLLEDSDYVLPKGVDSIWITVDNISVHVRRTDEGVIADLYALGRETDPCLAGTYAFFAEAE